MKILYARNAPYKPNINSYNVQAIGLCREFCDNGIDCDILFYSDENKDELIYENGGKKVNILWRKGYKILRTGYYPKLLNEKFTRQYDYIITTEYNQLMSLLWTKYHSKVILYHGPYYNMFVIPFFEKIYDFMFSKKIKNGIYKTFAKSVLAKEYLLKRGFNEVEVLGVGLNTNIFNSDDKPDKEINKVIEYMKNNKCMLYIGQLIDRKNFKFGLEVFNKVCAKEQDVKFIIIGRGEEKYINESFSLLKKEAKKNIYYIDKVDNKYLKYIYQNADIFILPSKQEIFGMVLLEAMYFGVPVITSKNGGACTLIDEHTGIINEKFNANEWADEVLTVLNDSGYKNKLSYNSKKKIKENFTWKTISYSFLEAIKIEK